MRRMNRGRSGYTSHRHRGAPRNRGPQNRNRLDDPGKRLSESSVKITEYISDLPGFSGIIKARYSDFHVNEIDEAGNITKLTMCEAPPVPCEVEGGDEDLQSDEENPDKFNIKILPLETWKQLAEIIEQNDTQVVKVDATNMSKEDRTKLHIAVKQKFGSKLVGSTLNEDEKKFITFSRFAKNDTKRDTRVKWLWPGEWVHFLIHKENKDTMQAAVELASALQMKPGNITYAGTKDRRGKTTQWFCVRKTQPERLIKASGRCRNILVGNFTFKDAPLRLGQLKGNRFRIALRNVVGEDDIINKALESLKTRGFINYYGLQRFGSSCEVPTHQIGLTLLQGNWKEAIELILKPREEESDYQMREARKIWSETKDPRAALNKLGRNNSSVEAKLLYGMCDRSANDHVSALENIPRNMRLLYIHSYQSLIWNSMVSRRIREGGLTPMIGDLVLLENQEIDIIMEDSTDLLDDIESEEYKQEVNEASGNDKNLRKAVQVKPLTQEDLDLGSYTIFDIVMPLPGYDVEYPDNKIADWYKEILAKDGLTSESMKNRVKTYSLSGAYRHIIAKPDKMDWKITFYDDPEQTLILSDYEELKGTKALDSATEGKYRALILDFCLKSSTYATMALREILKGDTSSASQAKLNNYHDDAKSVVADDVESRAEKRHIDEPELNNDTKKFKTE